MKPYIIVLTIMFSVLFSCQSVEKLATAEMEVKEMHLESFHAIEVASGIDVTVYKSNENRAKITSKYMEYTHVEIIEGGRLKIYHEFPEGYNINFNDDHTEVEVWATDINYFEAKNSGDIEVEGNFTAKEQTIVASSSGDVEYDVACDKLYIQVNSSGDVESKIKVKELIAETSSSGDIELKGFAQTAILRSASSGDIDAEDLIADYVIVDGSSSGDINISVNKEIKGELSSSANLYYKANGSINFDVRQSSGADIEEIQ